MFMPDAELSAKIANAGRSGIGKWMSGHKVPLMHVGNVGVVGGIGYGLHRKSVNHPEKRGNIRLAQAFNIGSGAWTAQQIWKHGSKL